MTPPWGVKALPLSRSDGYRTWSEEDIATFEAAHPIGSRARLAFTLAALHRRKAHRSLLRSAGSTFHDGVLDHTPEQDPASR